MTTDAIPEYIIGALETVRASGVTNMLARDVEVELYGVIRDLVDAMTLVHDCAECGRDETICRSLYRNPCPLSAARRVVKRLREEQETSL